MTRSHLPATLIVTAILALLSAWIQCSVVRDTRHTGVVHGDAVKFANHPGAMLHWYLLGKPASFLSWGIITGDDDVLIYPVAASPYQHDPVFVAMRQASRWLHWPLMLLALAAALVALWRPRWLAAEPTRRTAIAALGALFLYLVVLHAIGAPYPRYNIPFRPLAFVLALVALRALLQRPDRGKPAGHTTRRAAPGAALPAAWRR